MAAIMMMNELKNKNKKLLHRIKTVNMQFRHWQQQQTALVALLLLPIAYVLKVFATKLKLTRLFNYKILLLIVQNLYHKTGKN